MSLIQFKELTMFYTHEKKNGPIRIIVNDCIFMCKKNYTSNQKPQRCISSTPSFQPSKGFAARPLPCELLYSQFNQEICWVWGVKESLFHRKQVRWNSPEIGIEKLCIIYFIVTDEKKIVEQQVEGKNISACVVLLIGAILSSVFRLIVECNN